MNFEKRVRFAAHLDSILILCLTELTVISFPGIAHHSRTEGLHVLLTWEPRSQT